MQIELSLNDVEDIFRVIDDAIEDQREAREDADFIEGGVATINATIEDLVALRVKFEGPYQKALGCPG